MIHGSCHCGIVTWSFNRLPESATACNCTVCRRYGALWAYDYENQGVKVAGPTKLYIRDESLAFHFCGQCGCVAYWRAIQSDAEGGHRIAVNLRLTEPEPIAHIPIRHFDGFDRFLDLPQDGRCVTDYWF